MQASEHPLVHDLVPTVPAWDGKQADVFVRGMSIGNGRPVVGDMCMGNALHVNSTPYAHASAEDGKKGDRTADATEAQRRPGTSSFWARERLIERLE